MSEPFISYAQNGEDIILWRALRDVESGYFVDVGAADPVGYSATYALYLRGWTGLNLEPVEEFATALRTVRPRDTTLQLAAGSSEGSFTAFVVEGTGLSTMDAERAKELRQTGFEVREDSVQVRTLTSILDGHVESGRPIHMLKIDVEGFEREVLLGLDLERYRPWVLVIESTRPMSQTQSHEDWEDLVIDRNYHFCLFDGLNRYYVAHEHADLTDRLDHGPSVFDRPYQMSDVTLGIERHREHLVAELAASQAALAAEQRSRSELATWSEALGRERDQYRDRATGLTDDLARLTADLARSTADLAQLRDVVAAEQAKVHELERISADSEQRALEALDVADAERQRADAAVNALGPLQSEVVELRERSDFAAVQIQELYNSETWRLGRAMWHAGRKSGLNRLARGPLGHVLDRAFGANPDPQPPAPPVEEEVTSITRDAWVFPHTKEWTGELGPLADTLSNGWLVDGREIRRLISFLDADSSDTLLNARFSADERVALNQLALSVAGRVRRAPVPGRVVIDARCLDDPGLRDRGVGRHARGVLERLGPLLAPYDDIVVLRSEPSTADLPDAIATRARTATAERYGTHEAPPELFITLSPSTASIVPQCVAGSGRAIAVVYDLIPFTYPRHYHGTALELVTYVGSLSWLRSFDELWCISHATAAAVQRQLGIDAERTRVTGVDSPLRFSDSSVADRPDREALHILLCGGGDARKNMLTVVEAAISLATPVHIESLGHLPHGLSSELHLATVGTTVSITESDGLTDEQVVAAFERCDIVAVPSYAEGFSLPVAEGLLAGRPVVASRIDAHAELLAEGPWLVEPDDVVAWAAAFDASCDNRDEWLDRQREQFERSVAGRWPIESATLAARRQAPPLLTNRRPSLAVVTPLPPQPSGIADYSAFTLPALADYFDLSFVTNSPAEVSHTVGPTRGDVAQTRVLGEFDHVLHVLGNSHFHVPTLELLAQFGGAALAHDNRMSSLYYWWKGAAEAARIMSMHGADVGEAEVAGLLIDLDAAPDTCYGEIVEQAEPLFVHSRLLARMLKSESGRDAVCLPFCPYRLPTAKPRPARRTRKRIASFGETSVIFKRHDLMIEMLAWLRQWGEDVEFVIVGGGTDREIEAVSHLATECGVDDRVTITGRVDEHEYRRWLGDVDAAVQVRNSALLSLSGAVLDTIAFGIPLVTTQSALDEMPDAPNVVAVPNHFSSFQLATAALEALRLPRNAASERSRNSFLTSRSPKAYAAQLAAVLLES